MNEPAEVGEWVRVSQLGEGGFGIVTLWKNKDTQEFIAIKKCRWYDPSMLTDRQKERWISEVKMMQQIKNDNIVNFVKLPTKLDLVLSRHNSSKLPILSMEYCSKGNLRHVLTMPENTCGFPEAEAKVAMLDLANAVGYLHSLKITHRDLKPENIVLQHCDRRPNKVIYKVIDLGYAKEINTNVASFVGTMQYLAPEIFMAEKYNYTVDYWSLGNVIFEIACGVHPFLPFAPPPERFKHLQKKKYEDIYFYINEEGTVKYSSEIPKETHISSYLKQELEKWLRQMLQFEPSNRGSKNGVDVFSNLKILLRKKIVKIFSVYTYEFYYYEINDSTLLSTLQDWFARDTKIPKNEQLILSNKFFFEEDENLKVVDCICDKMDSALVIFKMNESLSKTIKPIIPKCIKRLFNDFKVKLYKWDEFKSINSHAIFYINQEQILYSNLITAFELFLQYINKTLAVENQEFSYAKHAGVKLLTEISCYNNLSKQVLGNVHEFNKSLIGNLAKLQQRLGEANVYVEDLNKLSKKHTRLVVNKEIFRAKNLEEIKPFDMRELCEKAIHALRSSKTEGQKEFSPKDILVVVNDAIKARHSLIKYVQVNYYSYFKSAWTLLNRSRRYISRSREISAALKEISLHLANIEEEKYKIILHSRNDLAPVCNHQSISKFEDIDVDEMLQTNTFLRYKLQDEVDRTLVLHKSNINSLEVLISLMGLQDD